MKKQHLFMKKQHLFEYRQFSAVFDTQQSKDDIIGVDFDFA